MKKENMERGFEIQQSIETVEYNLAAFKDTEKNPTASDLSYYGTGISSKAVEEIRTIAIRALSNKRRSLQREFNKL